MSLSQHLRRAVMIAPVLAAIAACSGKDPYDPGTKLGTFRVSAQLTKSSCGPTPNPWGFDVRLNHEGSTLYWIQGAAPISARVEAARAQLRAEIVQEVRAADPKAKRAACAIARTDELALALAGADATPVTEPASTAAFAGTLVYTFAPTQGSDCSDQVAASGGGFEALPCEVQYDLTGALVSGP